MRRAVTLLSIAALALSACGRLPAGAPVSEEILKESQQESAEFALYQVTRSALPSIAQWPPTGTEEVLPWIRGSQGPKTQLIQPGDQLTLRIWDSGGNSLLTTDAQKDVQLQDVTVASNGTVFMPYVGNVSVRGLTPDLARERLQDKLEIIVPSAQLQLSMKEGRNNSVDLVSGVNQPGGYPMPDRNFTVMGLISAGGGISSNLNNPQIRLVRGGRIFGTSVEALLDNPSYDTLLRGGDRVFVEEDARYFLSFGATGKEDLHIFTKDVMTAMDAMSVTGGFQDSRADPQGLLILREYPASAVTPGTRGPRHQQVVFSIDLTTADGLFSARKLKINSGDLLIATESPVNDVVTVSTIAGNFIGLFRSASNI